MAYGGRVRAVLVVALVLSAVPGTWGQSTLAFDVASLKRSLPEERIVGMFVYPGGRLTVTNYTLRMLIHDAYGVQDYQISGGPKWAGEDRYDIEARPPADSKSAKVNPANIKLPPESEELQMLRALLAARFRLSLHEESKEGPVLALVIASHGPRLTESRDKGALPAVTYGRTGKAEPPDVIQGYNASMARLATRLSSLIGGTVLDKTGLNGAFDFRLQYSASLSISDDGPSLSSAIQQLGLMLVPAKVPVPLLVIDRAEKPADN
jgi:uncharacterized protein (TIGR03435 family)